MAFIDNLFTRKEVPGSKRTMLIVGLGNIGKKYVNTRHNLGFIAVEKYADTKKLPSFKRNKKLDSYISKAGVDGVDIILAKPTTLMNLSGQAVYKIMNYFDINNEDILVIHDDLDLATGVIRQRMGGGSGGHNGIKSITKHIGENYARLRIGIDRPNTSSEEYVLKDLSGPQLSIINSKWDKVVESIDQFIQKQYTDHTIK